jgi:hypothetical protein
MVVLVGNPPHMPCAYSWVIASDLGNHIHVIMINHYKITQRSDLRLYIRTLVRLHILILTKHMLGNIN